MCKLTFYNYVAVRKLREMGHTGGRDDDSGITKVHVGPNLLLVTVQSIKLIATLPKPASASTGYYQACYKTYRYFYPKMQNA